jgi:hypothetical protein
VPDLRAYSLSADAFRSDSLWTVAYAGAPDAVAKAVKAECDLLGATETAVANGLGFVCFDTRRLGIKKCGGGYVLGLGAKASPLQFAAVAGRVDNCLQLLRCGANPDIGCPSAAEIARTNEFQAITDLIAAFKKVEEGAKKKKQKKVMDKAQPADSAVATSAAAAAHMTPATPPPTVAASLNSVPPVAAAQPAALATTANLLPGTMPGPSVVPMYPVAQQPVVLRSAPDP